MLLYAGIVSASAAVLVCALPGQIAGILAASGVGVVAGCIVVQIASRRIRHRLHELREATDALGGGAVIPHVPAMPNDECSKLSESVDRLATQIRDMIEERDQLRRRLSRSEKLAVIGELAATVAHEVNNPLDGLQNSIRIVRRRVGDDASTRELLHMMEQGLARIETTVRRLLSMSRDEPIHPVPTPAEDIVDDAVLFVQPRLNRYGIQLVRDFAIEPVLVVADAVHMAQVLINLMINAADAMKATGGTMTIRCQSCGDGKAWLDVIDTGCGISERDLPHIFEPFYSTKGKGVGTGLGLAVVARVVEAHKGRVEVHTTPGEGTCFRIELPAACPMMADEAHAPVTREESVVHGTSGLRSTISSESV